MYEAVLKTIHYDHKKDKWILTDPESECPTESRRSVRNAFLQGFRNSVGRKFVEFLLRDCLGEPAADIENVGGGATPNDMLHGLELVYNYHTSCENSPEIDRKDKTMEQSPERSPERSLEKTPETSPEKTDVSIHIYFSMVKFIHLFILSSTSMQTFFEASANHLDKAKYWPHLGSHPYIFFNLKKH